jgi:hypothetical protein
MQWLHEMVLLPVWQTAQGKALQVGWVGMIGAGGGVGILGGGGGFSFLRGGSVTGGVDASFSEARPRQAAPTEADERRPRWLR